MDTKLFQPLEEWNLSREKLNEYAELLGRLTGLPNATYDIAEKFQEEVRHELELWRKLEQNFGDRTAAVMAYASACNEIGKE